jgi:hypothetical protein
MLWMWCGCGCGCVVVVDVLFLGRVQGVQQHGATDRVGLVTTSKNLNDLVRKLQCGSWSTTGDQVVIDHNALRHLSVITRQSNCCQLTWIALMIWQLPTTYAILAWQFARQCWVCRGVLVGNPRLRNVLTKPNIVVKIRHFTLAVVHSIGNWHTTQHYDRRGTDCRHTLATFDLACQHSSKLVAMTKLLTARATTCSDAINQSINQSINHGLIRRLERVRYHTRNDNGIE